MSIPLVSIIIPVFNAERYLTKCLKSIIKQSYEHIEILVINDGSSDNSLSIINEFSRKDPRIHILSKKNSGPSETRNLGLEHATGEFISFVDADDWIHENMIEQMVFEMSRRRSDLVICEVLQFDCQNDNYTPRRTFKLSELDQHASYDALMSRFISGEFDFANWNKLYKRAIIEENRIRFQADLRIGEDFIFNLIYLNHVSRHTLVYAPMYNYRIHENSLFHGNRRERWVEHCKKLSILEAYCEDGKVTLSSRHKSILFEENTAFVELPSIIQHLRDRRLLFHAEAVSLLGCAQKEWFRAPIKTTSIKLQLLLFTLRNNMLFVAFTLMKFNRQ